MGMKNNIIEFEKSYGFTTDTGCEVYSNDQLLKIILQKQHNNSISIEGNESAIFYNALYYVKDGRYWNKVDGGIGVVMSINEFIDKLRHSEEFTEAVRDLLNDLKQESNEK